MAFRYRCHFLRLPALMVVAALAAIGAWAQDTIDVTTPGACGSTTNPTPCMATYHNDNSRDGVQPDESSLTPNTFPSQASANFGLLVPAQGGATGAVDALTYAQPLYLSGVTMGSATGCSGSNKNLVLVATENNSVYAFTYSYSLGTSYTFSLTQCWMLNLNGANEFAIPFTALSQNSGGTPCNNVVPQSGITSTPVVDASVAPPIMYVVTADQSASLTYTYRIHAINVKTGAELITNNSYGTAPYDLSAVFQSPITTNEQNQRPGLAMFKPSTGWCRSLGLVE